MALRAGTMKRFPSRNVRPVVSSSRFVVELRVAAINLAKFFLYQLTQKRTVHAKVSRP